MAETTVISLSFDKGLLESVAPSVVPAGFATVLKNWEPVGTGGVRVRVPWVMASVSGAPTVKAGRGIGYFSRMVTRKTPVYVQQAYQTGTGGALLSFANSMTAGSTIIVAIAGDTGTSVTVPGGFTLAGTAYDSGTRKVSFYTKTSNGGNDGKNTTWDTSGTGGWAAVGVEFLDLDPTPVDVNVNNTGTSGTPASGTLDPAVGEFNELLLTAFATPSSSSSFYSSPTNSFTEIREIGIAASPSVNIGLFGRIFPEDTSTSVTVTGSSSQTWTAKSIGFKAAKQDPVASTHVVVANAESGTEFKLYGMDTGDLGGGSWSNIDTISALGSTGLPVAFTMGMGAMFYTHPEFATTRKWDVTAAAAVAGSPAGRCIAAVHNRLFVGGTKANPDTLWFSGIDDTTTWPADNYLEFGRLDGEAIEDITPFEDGIVVVKTNSVWFLAGSGPDTFVIRRLLGGDAAPGRSVIATPYGAVIAGRDRVYLWDGSSVDRISDPIRDSYGLTGNYLTCSYQLGSVYINDPGSGLVFVLDMENGTWRIEEVGTATEAPAVLYNLNRTQFMAPINGALGFLAAYRHFPGTVPGKDFDTLSEAFALTTPEVWPAGPYTRITPMFLFVRVHQRGGDERETGITVTPIYDGVTYPARDLLPTSDRTTFRVRLDVGEQPAAAVESVQFAFAQTLPSGKSSCFDIDEVLFEYQTEQRR